MLNFPKVAAYIWKSNESHAVRSQLAIAFE